MFNAILIDVHKFLLGHTLKYSNKFILILIFMENVSTSSIYVTASYIWLILVTIIKGHDL